jgi:hypothetical protein
MINLILAASLGLRKDDAMTGIVAVLTIRHHVPPHGSDLDNL